MTFFDGTHGVLADSLSVTWQNIRDTLGLMPGPARFSGPRVAPDVGPLTTGRDWLLVELIDRTQLLKDNIRTVRAIQTTGLELVIGRGRVQDAMYAPDINVRQFPGRAPPAVGSNNIPARNRVTAFRATALDGAISCFAQETINIDPDPVYALENYRAYISEGRPTVQRRPDYAWCSARAELDVPLTAAGFGPLLTPVPDYATALRVDPTVDSALLLLGVVWVDVFGDRFPGSAATGNQAPVVTQLSSQPLTVPWWASSMHLVNLDPGGLALDGPFQVTWELTL